MIANRMQKEVYSRKLRSAVQSFFGGASLQASRRMLQDLFLAGNRASMAGITDPAVALFFIRFRHLLDRLPVLLQSGLQITDAQPGVQEVYQRGYPGVLPAEARLRPGKWLQAFLSVVVVKKIKRLLFVCISAANGGPQRFLLNTTGFQEIEQVLEACWYILYPYQQSGSDTALRKSFQFTGPLDLTRSERADPVAVIADFFSGWTVLSAQRMLKIWFKAALMPGYKIEDNLAAELIHFNNEFTRLLEAGQLVIHSSVQPIRPLSVDTAMLNGLLDSEAPDHSFCLLRLKPLQETELNDLAKLFSAKHIRKLRTGMHHWMLAAFSRSASVTDLDEMYLFPQFERMEAIVFGLYRLVGVTEECLEEESK
ncbi:hypothetical protein [Pedobacter sp. SYP-B3415]|uniref:hypothetical protein n=1 Tax=Pedobacter sp. SYP-B3415 TaxID=2496641 RepID=UPI0013ED07E9|nr:hypothetical protein [Pedobacter sp. SYP-B3415]